MATLATDECRMHPLQGGRCITGACRRRLIARNALPTAVARERTSTYGGRSQRRDQQPAPGPYTYTKSIDTLQSSVVIGHVPPYLWRSPRSAGRSEPSPARRERDPQTPMSTSSHREGHDLRRAFGTLSKPTACARSIHGFTVLDRGQPLPRIWAIHLFITAAAHLSRWLAPRARTGRTVDAANRLREFHHARVRRGKRPRLRQ